MTAADLSAGSRFALDARSLDGLRSQARKDPKAALQEAATQFEAVFVKALMKSMRDALPQGDPLASDTTRMVQGMYDEQLAQKLAGRGIGLAEMMVRQLERQSPEPVAALRLERAAQAGAAPASGPPSLAAPRSGAASGKNAAQAFVERLAPQAREAAAQTGVPARFILGQAALESGWGNHEIRGADGRGSHNLFGIKAGRSWKGATTKVMTTEYVDGVPRKQLERFRAYGSYTEAFADYARLLQTQPRYAEVLANAHDARAFAFGMQRAGYATDPRYGEKLARVIDAVTQRGAGV